jgi:NADPH:quinone reductase-like Zn-dependent oxidoreductase
MKAVRFHQHGGPDVLCYGDAPDPELAPGEVLVRVRACALNHLDVWARRGLPAIQIAVLHGARVIATADEIKRLTNRRGVDVVIEHAGLP